MRSIYIANVTNGGLRQNANMYYDYPLPRMMSIKVIYTVGRTRSEMGLLESHESLGVARFR